MAKAKKEIEVPVRVSLDTSQIVDLSNSIEVFVDGLADSVNLFLDDIKVALREFATLVSIDCADLRRNLPNLPTYTTDDLNDEVVCSPACPAGASGCPCREAI